MVARSSVKYHDYWTIFVRIIAIGVILTGISVGAKRTYFSLSASQVLGVEVDADLMLAALRSFAKSLYVLLVSSLGYTDSFILTVWMARPPSGRPSEGAMFSDFGLKDELMKPWTTIASFDWYGKEWGRQIVYEPVTPSGCDIVRTIAMQTWDSLAGMGTLIPTTGLLAQFLLMSRMLQEKDPAVKSDAAGLSISAGCLASEPDQHE
jgi:hypothetical protein